MKTAPIVFALMIAFAAAAGAERPSLINSAPILLPAGQPGAWLELDLSTTCLANPFTQYQPGPDPCIVCGPWPGEPQAPWHGPCQEGYENYYRESCSCPATGGGTIGGLREVNFACENGIWVFTGSGTCRTGGSPSWC